MHVDHLDKTTCFSKNIAKKADSDLEFVEDFREAAAAAAKSLQSCPTLCDPIDGSPPGSPVHGIS